MIGGRAEMETEMDYDAADNSAKCCAVAIEALRERLASFRCEEIGACKLYLGDCRELLPLLPKVDHVITDPPFDVEAHHPARRARSGGLHQNMPLDFAPLDCETRAAVTAAVAKGCQGWFVAFCQTEQVAGWRDDIEAAGLKYKTPMIWVKPDAVPKLNGQGPAIGYESMVTAWCGPGYAKWNGGGKRGVFTYMTNPSDRVPGRHMTEKPILLMADLIGLFTNPGQIVCDPFMGSGTTGVACVRHGRRFIGIEVDPKHFETACRRIEAATKQPDLFIEEPKKAEQLNLLESAE